MQNELLWVLLLAVNFSGVMLSYRFFGKIGLFMWTAMAVILANIQVMKTIEFFGLVTAMGNIIYSSLFLVTDILGENHSKKDARKAVWIGFFVLIATTIIMQITIYFIPHESDILSPHINAIFGLLPRIAFASLAAYLVSQMHDVWLYNLIRNKYGEGRLWVRNNLSTFISQLLDNTVFTLIAFLGVFSWEIIIQIFITSMIMKTIVAMLDTPFIYMAKNMKERGLIKDDN